MKKFKYLAKGGWTGMAVPDYQQFMLPFLRILGDGRVHSLSEIKERLAEEFGLTEEDRKELLPSGRQRTFDNRVGWARTYLKKRWCWRARDGPNTGSLPEEGKRC